MKTRYLLPILVAAIALVLGGCPSPVSPPADTVVTTLAIPGVTLPAAGRVPATTVETDQYSGTVSWSPQVSDAFAAHTVYTATLTLTPKDGFTFTGVAANSFTVDGASSVSHAKDSGEVTVVFPSTSAQTVSRLAIPGVAPPAVGADPTTSVETDQYSGTIGWSPAVSGTFAPSTTYTATITLTPKSGYTLSGVAENSFTVDGASSVTNGVDSGTVTAMFPSTSAQTISLLAIPYVPVPVAGASPTRILGTEEYSATVSWSPEVSDRFETTTVYTATLTITPTEPYTLTGVAANSFTVEGAASVTHAADSGVVTVVFPESSNDYRSDIVGDMVYVEGGSVRYPGTTADMTISSFRIGRYEITGDQYAVVAGSDPSFDRGPTDHPVTVVNWYDTLVFCNTLSMGEGLTPVYSIGGSTNPADWGTVPTSSDATWNAVVPNWSADGYRLPTAAEWYFAASGGNDSHGYSYAGSNTATDVGWFNTNSGGAVHTIGTRAPNELGLYDMSGNVAEFTWDWYGTRPSEPPADYRGPESGTARLMAGGTFGSNSAYRTIRDFVGNGPEGRLSDVGFRVVRR